MKPQLERILGWSAAVCWLASWFLPVIEGHAGWQAFSAAIQAPFRESFPSRGEHGIAQILSALTNLVFAALFLHWHLGRVSRPGLFTKVAVACLVLNLYWLVELTRAGEARQLLPGYYAWIVAFALLVAAGAVSAFSGRRTSKTPTAGTPS